MRGILVEVACMDCYYHDRSVRFMHGRLLHWPIHCAKKRKTAKLPLQKWEHAAACPGGGLVFPLFC